MFWNILFFSHIKSILHNILKHHICFVGVVPEVQCAVKRKEKKAQREKDKPNSTTDVTPEIIKIEPTEMKVF